MTYEVIAIDSQGRQRDAWVVDAENKATAVRIGKREVANLQAPVDSYTFEVHRCTVAGRRLREP